MTSVRLMYKTTDKVLKFVKTLWTAGNGLWSDRETGVKVKYLSLRGETDHRGKLYGELRVYFDPKSWNINTDGLIYTDRLFLTQLKTALRRRGLPDAGVDYSEQGMQGVDYVSLDVGDAFVRSYVRKRG